MSLIIIFKATKNQDFTLSLEDTFFEKPIYFRILLLQFAFKLLCREGQINRSLCYIFLSLFLIPSLVLEVCFVVGEGGRVER